MYKPIRSAELISGGNVVKQGEFFTLVYQLFDEDGQVVSLTGNTITVKIANKYGVVFESAASILTNGQISFDVNEDIGYGEMRIELAVTNGTTLVQKYPSDGWIKLDVTPSLDDLGFSGVNTITVASLKNELTQMQTAYESEITPKVDVAVSDSTTAKKIAETVQDQFDRVIAETGDSIPEITQARGGEVNLNTRLEKTAAQLADKVAKEEVDRLTQQLVPKRYVFGEQLEKLKYSLSNPLEQITGIAFTGDSITWGLGATGNPTDQNVGRDGTLSDIRDNFASLSFVNNFKRYIGSKYMFNTIPVLSNWQASPKGESIAEYTRQFIMYPYGGDFTYTTTGTMHSLLSRALVGPLSGFQLVINVESAKDGVGTISFPFTGEEFTLSFDSVDNGMNYEVVVDGVSQGVFTTAPGIDGNVAGYDNRRKHTFPYVRNKTVQIKTVKNNYVGVQTLRIGGIIINKKIRISNQGIIGTKAFYYKSRNMTGNTSGDGVAVGKYDNYIFCQLGSNDRIIETAYAKGSNEFKKHLKALVDELMTFGEVILMVANPVANESTTSFSFNMQDARNVVYRLAKENNLDFIDNYSIFGSVSTAVYTTDGLHLNDLGNEVITRNIINSLEFN